MKLWETSILELLIKPLGKIKIVNDYWGGKAEQAANFEHAYGPVVIAALFIKWLPSASVKWLAWAALVVVHLIVKELIVDPLVFKKPFNWPNVIERAYGCLLAAIVLV